MPWVFEPGTVVTDSYPVPEYRGIVQSEHLTSNGDRRYMVLVTEVLDPSLGLTAGKILNVGDKAIKGNQVFRPESVIDPRYGVPGRPSPPVSTVSPGLQLDPRFGVPGTASHSVTQGGAPSPLPRAPGTVTRLPGTNPGADGAAGRDWTWLIIAGAGLAAWLAMG